ncbi:ribosome assembly cofactor RimP [Aureispira anguillae]|uniref:Ribosome maturation factor RimP n=1 Tax=Aureispira anguillae TaxID=2864201 RepID=A0A916DX28_9BACT|nr:ribosome assembly cofactor RimP [Aureispira anguillae]BDS14636.1 ribosome assembly cofactor RimP [Aureispira anguillae]
MISLTEKLTALLEQKFQEEEFSHLFLIELKQLTNDVIQVFLDSDNSVTYEHCVKISRYLEEHIEEGGWLGEKYTLDVSSAGVGAPLKFKRQYLKNIGRNVSIEVNDDHKHIKGTLTEVKDSSVVIEYEEKVKIEGRKKKQLMTIRKEVSFDNIKKTIITISFK